MNYVASGVYHQIAILNERIETLERENKRLRNYPRDTVKLLQGWFSLTLTEARILAELAKGGPCFQELYRNKPKP
jgi:hypothetical protein